MFLNACMILHCSLSSQQLHYNEFPIAATLLGVFENLVYNNSQLTLNGHNLPDEVVDSQGARFVQQQFITSDLSSWLEYTKQFEDSIAMDKNISSRTPYVYSLSDGTLFTENIFTTARLRAKKYIIM